MNHTQFRQFPNIFLFAVTAWVLYGASVDFYNIAWGTGVWLGQFSLKWFFFFLLYLLFSLICITGLVLWLWFPERLESLQVRLASLRLGSGGVRWVIVTLLLFMPLYVLQYTFWGVVFESVYIRIVIWAVATLLVATFVPNDQTRLLSWTNILIALVLVSGFYNIAARLGNVTSYPFSLGWSEGNRLWDYSIMFGRSLYEIPADQAIPVYLDRGRQFVYGIPYLIPGITIWQERMWVGLVNIIPYLILGWVAFKLPGRIQPSWILAGIWAFTFVEQGPVHPPLLLCAILVAFAWRRSLWMAVPLILVASYFAQLSRYTWLFAPGMWAAMLEFSGPSYDNPNDRVERRVWMRAITVVIAGVVGGYLGPAFFPSALQWVGSLFGLGGEAAVHSTSLLSATASISTQELLWYRLFPNATYPPGILIGLLIAAAPVTGVLMFLSRIRRWQLHLLQKYSIILPLTAFLVVGVIVSIKIGGGGDLHNLDMFIIGLMFAGAIAWHNGARSWLEDVALSPAWIRLMLILLIVIPVYYPLMSLRPNSIADDMTSVITLADIPASEPLPETLPSETDTMKALNDIRSAVEEAAPNGEILFMDQRQLLTFGYITGIPLVPEYDKKVLINEALSANGQYFQTFYQDLADGRFSLIITHPLHEKIQTDTDQFGEENNAWVEWVSSPVLCFYEPLDTLKKVKIQLLVPKGDNSACEQYLEE